MFRKTLDFLDINVSENQILKAIEKSSFENLKQMEEKNGFKERSIHSEFFFRKGKVNEWKNISTKSQIKKIIGDHQAIMTKFGYIADN